MKDWILELFKLLWGWLCEALHALRLLFRLRRRNGFARKLSKAIANSGARRPPKPEWIRKEVIRLKALMAHDGCRKIADTFNRLYEHKKQMSVGKTYVYETLKKHYYKVLVLRRRIKHKKPRTLPKNLIWSADLTQVADESGKHHTVFGLLDSGTRACLSLRHLRTKASITLLRALCDAIECYGKPKAVRTDNEAVFASRLFRWGLRLLGIKHQRTDVCCPWMNGKVERFFGTLKQKLTGYSVLDTESLATDLHWFRFWYNTVRPHQHLEGRTPAELWNGARPRHRSKPVYFNAWNGALSGFYLRPT